MTNNLDAAAMRHARADVGEQPRVAFAGSPSALPWPTTPDFAGKLLMRIRSLKWHVATTASTSHHASARMAAAAILVHLDAMEVAARDVRTEAESTAGELQVDGLSVRFTALGPH